jgi:hypothetical protein
MTAVTVPPTLCMDADRLLVLQQEFVRIVSSAVIMVTVADFVSGTPRVRSVVFEQLPTRLNRDNDFMGIIRDLIGALRNHGMDITGLADTLYDVVTNKKNRTRLIM